MFVSWLQVRDTSGRWHPYAPPDGGAASARRPVGTLARGSGAEQTATDSVGRRALELTNESRLASGRPRLQWSQELATKAAHHLVAVASTTTTFTTTTTTCR
ncbi:unnamed protein product [Vitrella brassicaformis CCMP3155]|uniref:Uncharacterized protein n=1 Tax=Vitrella brassicaformis (strain CCMP3155) TaxID=1169540 RepID=A0A0G4G6C7_VITBC|nr:unnamed protein product [Vitrella brassicaformis CCMP3155]|eukprot:CEM24118.1 unnamed protein product [Vitrella brassicaformis CCMP3155]